MKLISVDYIPRKFDINLYFDTSTGKIIELDDVDDVLNYETEKVFENYYRNLKNDKLIDIENRLMHEYIAPKIEEFLNILWDKPQMKQRDALDYINKVKYKGPYNLASLATIVKEYPTEYKHIARTTIDTVKGFDYKISVSDIDKLVLDEEDLVNISETLSIPSTQELYLENFIHKLIKYLYSVILESREYNNYINKSIDKQMPKIEKELMEAYDDYKNKNYNKCQLKKATDIVNLYDFVLKKNLVSWLDKGNKITMITSMKYVDDKVYLNSGEESFTILKYDIVKMRRDGNRFTIVV